MITATPRSPNEQFDEYADAYRDLLDQSVSASGETGEYFANFKARYMRKVLGDNFSGVALDYGCGIGLLTSSLLKSFPKARVIGFDPSATSIQLARRTAAGAQLTTDESTLPSSVDTIVLANVMHHILPEQRTRLMSALAERLSPSGRLFIFEHNPVNPLTRVAVCNCILDHDAILLRPPEMAAYLCEVQLHVLRHDYIVFFPRRLKWLRPMEKFLTWCPLGAQYAFVGTPNQTEHRIASGAQSDVLCGSRF